MKRQHPARDPAGARSAPTAAPSTESPSPATTGHPAVSASGSGMGSGDEAGIQRGTINQDTRGRGADPSLGAGMAAPARNSREGDAATGGAPTTQRGHTDVLPAGRPHADHDPDKD